MVSADPPHSDVSDEEIVVRAQAGDPEAFREIFDRFYPMVHAFCYRACLDHSWAQDLAQETFIKAARSLGTFRADSLFKSWLYRIATNAVRDGFREQGRRVRIERLVEEQGGGEMAPEENSAHARVAGALGRLPEDLRLAIVLTFYEGMSHAAAAQMLGCAETTVSWRVFRAKRKLKTLLSRREP